MNISTATSVFFNYLIPDAVEQVIEAGFDGIDIWCGRPHLYRQDYPPDTLIVMKQRLDQAGLAVVSLMPAFFRYPFSFSSPVDAIRDDSVAYMKACIDNALVMGAGHVLVVPSHSLHGQTTGDARKSFIDSLGKVCEYAEQKKMKLGIEIVYPQLSDYMHSSRDAMQVIRELGSSALGVVIDSGHLNLSGENLETVLNNLGDLLLQVHVNDNDGKQQQNAIPGEGVIDFGGLVNLLRKFGYDGFLTLELGWGYTFDPLPAAREALARVRNFLRLSSQFDRP